MIKKVNELTNMRIEQLKGRRKKGIWQIQTAIQPRWDGAGFTETKWMDGWLNQTSEREKDVLREEDEERMFASKCCVKWNDKNSVDLGYLHYVFDTGNAKGDVFMVIRLASVFESEQSATGHFLSETGLVLRVWSLLTKSLQEVRI